MQVLKFGGSSVADATRISAVLDIIVREISRDRMILVCSAVRGCTDRLIELDRCCDPALRKAVTAEIRDRHAAIINRLFTGQERAQALAELDATASGLLAAPAGEAVCFGELFSTRIIARKCSCEGIRTEWIDSRELIVCTEDGVDEERSYANIRRRIAHSPDTRLFVAPGFIASGPDGRPTTLGRGGSDYSAALYAAGSDASVVEIWTDVPGIMTANPKVIPSAATIPDISYEAALRLAEAGAKVLYAPTVRPAMQASIPIRILDSFDPGHPGTLVGCVPGGPDRWMGVTSLAGTDGTSTLCLVGEGVPSRRTAAARILSALSEAGVKPLSDIWGEGSAFYFSVRTLVENEALAAVHREFFEARTLTELPVFIAGYGAVGKTLAGLIESSRERVAARLGRSIKIVGVSDSRRFVIDLRGLRAHELGERLSSGQSAADGAFVDAVAACALRKSVFVDCTDDSNLHRRYPELFRAGMNVVTSNRRSLAVPYAQYAAIKAEARENGCSFRYDTTVGNAIPILEYLAGGANCCDTIESIEAVVSCTLNYVITGYDGPRTDALSTLLRKAQDVGLTEKDPRTDLGGRDVLRKLLILAREAGVPLEEGDVKITPLLPEDFFGCSLDEFYRKLSDYEPRFIEREEKLDNMGRRQRFVASLTRDPSARLGYRAEISMRLVGEESPFYHISGTENVVIVRSEHTAPLVIKGAGEGVRLAATGIIRDILL